MTFRRPRRDWRDRLLGLFGKRRAILLPDEIDSFPPGYRQLRFEGFWSALLRPTSSPLPADRTYAESWLVDGESNKFVKS